MIVFYTFLKYLCMWLIDNIFYLYYNKYDKYLNVDKKILSLNHKHYIKR